MFFFYTFYFSTENFYPSIHFKRVYIYLALIDYNSYFKDLVIMGFAFVDCIFSRELSRTELESAELPGI